jgi:hypothetical protein
MTLFNKVFSTKALMLIACFLSGILFMKGLGAYYDFDWASALAAE